MSFQAMTWAVTQQLPCTQKIVLLMLANCCNHHTGKCVPKIKTLADECGLSESAVKSSIKNLAEANLIEIVPRFYEGVQLSNSYVLLLEGWVAKKPRVGQEKTPVGLEVTTEPGIEPGIETIPRAPKGVDSEIFQIFWDAWPPSDRKQDKVKCLAKWKKDKFDRCIADILSDIECKKKTDKWRDGFMEAPLVYLNGRRWEDGSAAGKQSNISPHGNLI